MTFPVNLEIYHQIDTKALFNLKPEIRSPFKGKQFNPDIDIHIKTTLQPGLLPLLVEKAETPEEAATYLINLSQELWFSELKYAKINRNC